MKKSSIILLDEATSSLDSETEFKIQEALKILTKNKTTIVIAHRLSTILNYNNIYVIDSGKVVDNGKHIDLIEKSSLYKSFYEKQFKNKNVFLSNNNYATFNNISDNNNIKKKKRKQEEVFRKI